MAVINDSRLGAFKLTDTVTVEKGYVLILDTSDTTGETLNVTTSADQVAVAVALEDSGSATAGENAKERVYVKMLGEVAWFKVGAAGVTIGTQVATSVTSGCIAACTGAAGDYAIGIALATKSSGELCPVLMSVYHSGATS